MNGQPAQIVTTALYDRWLASAIGPILQPEAKATCSACVMCEPAQVFSPSTKCCTFMPVLPNFLTGMILGDDTPAALAGRASVLARLGAGSGATPLGLGRPSVYALVYDAVTKKEPTAFGRSTELLCPHYNSEGGSCTIWPYRNSVCATWFCRHDRGHAGWSLWASLRELIGLLESRLSWWCVQVLFNDTKRDSRALSLLSEYQQSGDEGRLRTELATDGASEVLQALWGRWWSERERFFLECATLVRSLSWDDVLNRTGPEVSIRVQQVQRHIAELEADIPRRVRLQPFRVVHVRDGYGELATHSRYDTLLVPLSVLPLLENFDAAEGYELRPESKKYLDAGFDTALLQQLIDYGVLTAVPGSRDATSGRLIKDASA